MYNRLFWQRWLDEATQRYGIEEMDAARFVAPKTFSPTPPSGPSIGGKDVWQYRDWMENQHRWETEQYQYPGWVQDYPMPDLELTVKQAAKHCRRTARLRWADAGVGQRRLG